MKLLAVAAAAPPGAGSAHHGEPEHGHDAGHGIEWEDLMPEVIAEHAQSGMMFSFDVSRASS